MSDMPEPTTILISNPSNLPVIDYRTVKPLQGELKDLSKQNYQKLKNVLIKRGFKVPLFLWHMPASFKDVETAYYLMDGHQRQRVMIKEDMQPYEVPYILIEAATEAEARAQLLEISSQYGTITQEGLDEFSAELPEADLKDLNFDALPHFSREDTDVEEDEAPAVGSGEAAASTEAVVYQLGRHRLMCGDSTNGEAVNTLLAGIIPVLMVTDPPYGVSYDADWRDETETQRANSRSGDVLNDDRVDWTEAYELFGGDVAYVWHSALHTIEVGANLESLGYKLIAQIIWAKQHLVLSRGDYHWQHEPCWYAVKDGSKHNWQGDRTQTTVWNIANSNPFTGNANTDDMKTDHGTQKPVECMAKPILNNSAKGDAIYDPFGGSGTTLIAAEQLDRTCYMMELDPAYCDVIRKRYAKFIGREEDWEAATPAIEPAVV